jgi:predicted GH43/DUF377 family glycosyl hydrolase
VYQTFPTTPGQVCEVSAWVQSWSAAGPGASQLRTQDDRDNVTWYVRVDPEGGTDPWAGRVRASRGFGYSDGVYDTYARISLTFVAAGDQATVFFENTRLWPFMNNASYLDNAYAGCTTPAEPVTPPPPPAVQVGPFEIVARHLALPPGMGMDDVLRVGEEWWAYYSTTRDGRSVIGRATSRDGLTWTAWPEPVLEAGPPGTWNAQIGGASAVYDPETDQFVMAFVGHTGEASNYENSLGIATSPDGLRFTLASGDPIITHGTPGAWDEQRIDGVELVQDGEGYVLYYVGSTLQPDLIRQIGCASSPDGQTWTPCPSNPVLWPEPEIAPWEGLETELPEVIVHEGAWLMAYTGYLGPQGNAWRMGLAASSDGQTWTRLVTDPLVPAADVLDASTLHPALVLDAEQGQLWLYYFDIGQGSGVNVAVAPVAFGE